MMLATVLLLVCIISPSLVLSTDGDSLLVLVSGYNEAFNIFNVTGGGHTVSLVSRPQVPASLSWLDLGPRAEGGEVTLYAAHEATGEVSRLQLAADLGTVTTLETVQLPGAGPAHVLADRERGQLYSANYGSGTWTVLALDSSGALGGVLRHEQFPGPGLNCTSHPHQTVVHPSAGWVWVADLGCDAVYTLAPDTARPGAWWHLGSTWQGVRRWGTTEVRPGCGPRHLALHPSRDLAALLCEQTSLVLLYTVDTATGALQLAAEAPLSSEAADYGAEIAWSEAGDRLYASSRGTGVVVVWALQETAGTGLGLARLQEVSVWGSWPRHFSLRPEAGLLATSDQRGDSLQLLHLDPASGLLVPGKIVHTEHSPAFVTFLN